MKIHTFNGLVYYETNDSTPSKEDFPEPGELEESLNWIIKAFTRRKLFREILKLYSKKNNLHGYALLQAHSGRKKGKWWFSDRKRDYILQNWINKVDGTTLAILLYCCNEHNLEVKSEQSIIIHSTSKLNAKKFIQNRARMRIYMPREGYLDTHYRLRKTIDSLV